MTDPCRPRAVVVSHEATRTGAPRVVCDLLDGLRAAGWETTVWHRWGGPLAAELDAHADRSVRQPLNRLRVALRRRTLTKPLATRFDAWGTRRLLRRLRPDLVWCNTTATTSVAVAAAAEGLPTVLHSHEQADWIDRVIAPLPAGALRGVALVGCSADAADLLATAAGVHRSEVAVLTSAVDVASLAAHRATLDPDRPTVVACGTVDHRKGADVFAAAADLDRSAEGVRARWRWVGRGAPLDEADEVEWVGERPTAVDELASASVVVLASRAESFPLVVLEAMALGRPVVASALPGPSEQLGDAGVLVPPGDPGALAGAVRRLLDDPEEARRLGEAAAARCSARWDVATFRTTVAELADRVAPRAAGPDRVAPVRVLHAVHRLSHGGGVQVVIRNVARGLDPDAIDLHVVTVRPRLDADNVDELPVTLHPLGLATGRPGLVGRLRLAWGVARVARRIDAQVVQLHSGTAWLGLLARVAVPRAAFVLEVHDAPGSGRHATSTDRFESLWVRCLGATAVCHSTSVADDVRRRWHPRAHRLVTFPLAVDLDRLGPPTSAERAAWRADHGIPDDLVLIVTIGRMVPSKRFVDAVRAVDAAERPDRLLGLQLLGDGSERASIEAELRRCDREDRSWVIGSSFDLRLALGSADVLLSASEYEGFGLTQVEAMACGLPVVARAVGGTPDVVVDGVTGTLVASDRWEDLGAALADLVADPERRRVQGEAGRQRAEARYGVERLATAFGDLYRDLARARR